ncbi:uncharacterized protein LOC135204981 isoform X2 [Macrobrachium nipponense]|uniref:uncharacterized protein LOC135204981 isoform X2 n=1 Tax=Macrobrachium nipponense TaxID=159736 RepID=UPI0030C82B20
MYHEMFPAWLLCCLLVTSASTFVAAQTSDASGTSTITDKPSVLYIESSYGNFFIATGKALNDSGVDWRLEVEKQCMCRILCLTNASCMAVSSEAKGNRYLCKFATRGPMNTTVDTVSNNETTYIYRLASLVGKNWGVQKDKLYYFEMPTWMTFPDGMASCRRIPGFRPPIIRIKEVLSAIQDSRRAHYMDLHKKPGGILEWGDSTRFTNSENISMMFYEAFTSASTGPFLRPVFYYWRGTLYDQILGNLERIVCQANPLGVDW